MEKGQEIYVSSSDRRQKGFYGKVVSIGSKYVTVETKYGKRYRFHSDNHWCVEWGIYHLEESYESYQERIALNEKMRYIEHNPNKLFAILTKEELEDIYNRMKKL